MAESRVLRSRFARRAAMCIAGATLVCIAAVPGAAQQAFAVEIDAAKTTVEFTLHDVLHTVHGNFKVKNGTIVIVPETAAARGSIVIDGTTGESGNGSRDSKMHNQILESAKFPDITFTPAQVNGTIAPQGDSQVDVRGLLTLHGQGHETVVRATVHIDGTEVTSDASFPVPYLKWGVKNPSTLFLRVSDVVQINAHLVGHIKPLQ
jgi:polyisoprenoid-binding protein YceI